MVHGSFCRVSDELRASFLASVLLEGKKNVVAVCLVSSIRHVCALWFHSVAVNSVVQGDSD